MFLTCNYSQNHENWSSDTILCRLFAAFDLFPDFKCLHLSMARFFSVACIGFLLPTNVRVCFWKSVGTRRVFRCTRDPEQESSKWEGRWPSLVQGLFYHAKFFSVAFVDIEVDSMDYDFPISSSCYFGRHPYRHNWSCWHLLRLYQQTIFCASMGGLHAPLTKSFCQLAERQLAHIGK